MVRKTISRAEAIKTIAQAREAVCSAEELQLLLEDAQENTVYEALLAYYAGVTNGFLSQVCEAITGEIIEVIGNPAELLPCPCCNRKTLTERYDPMAGTGYNICSYCWWEDDGTADENMRSGVNRGSMKEYRERIRADSNYYQREKWIVCEEGGRVVETPAPLDGN